MCSVDVFKEPHRELMVNVNRRVFLAAFADVSGLRQYLSPNGSPSVSVNPRQAATPLRILGPKFRLPYFLTCLCRLAVRAVRMGFSYTRRTVSFSNLKVLPRCGYTSSYISAITRLLPFGEHGLAHTLQSLRTPSIDSSRHVSIISNLGVMAL